MSCYVVHATTSINATDEKLKTNETAEKVDGDTDMIGVDKHGNKTVDLNHALAVCALFALNIHDIFFSCRSFVNVVLNFSKFSHRH